MSLVSANPMARALPSAAAAPTIPSRPGGVTEPRMGVQWEYEIVNHSNGSIFPYIPIYSDIFQYILIVSM